MSADAVTETAADSTPGPKAPGEPAAPSSGADPPDDGGRSGAAAKDRWTSRLTLVAGLAALVPLVVAAVRAITGDWVPVGDSALIAIRSRDVLGGGELPLIGMWSSSSWSVGFDFNHPGPLFYDLLAVPAALFPGPTGLVVGSTLVGVVSIVGCFVVARRRGGPLVASAAMAVATGLTWSMGSAALVEPWHANTLLLPFLCFLLLVWSVACGDLVCLPWAVGVGSLLVQTNLGYGAFVPVLLLLALGVLLVDHARQRRRVSDGHPDPVAATGRRRLLVRLGLVSLVVAALCWAQPLAEQSFGRGEGNISRALRSLRESTGTLDWQRAFRATAEILALPPWWGRPSFSEAFRFGAFGNPLPSLPAAVVGLALLGALLVAGRWWPRRPSAAPGAGGGGTDGGPDPGARAVDLALVLVVLSVVAANLTPTIVSFGTVAYQLRWLWAVAAFVWFALVVAGLGRLPAEGRTRSLAAGVLVGITVVLAVLGSWPATGGTTAPSTATPVAHALVGQLADADLEGPYLIDCDEGTYDPYCEPVMFELQRQGVEFLVRDDVEIRQLGEDRRWDGTAVAGVLRVVAGDFAVFTPPEADQVALIEGLDQADHLELIGLVDEIESGLVDEGALRLNDRGRRVAARGDLASMGDGSPPSRPIDPVLLLGHREQPFGEHRRELVAMVREDLLDVDAGWAARLERYADLQERWDLHTVGAYVQPLAAYEDEGGRPPDPLD